MTNTLVDIKPLWPMRLSSLYIGSLDQKCAVDLYIVVSVCSGLEDVEVKREEEKDGDDGSQEIVQMKLRLPLMMEPVKTNIISDSAYLLTIFLLLSWDGCQWCRWIDAWLWAVQIDYAPISNEKHRRENRRLEQVTRPDVLADKSASPRHCVVHHHLNVSGYLRPLDVLRCVDDFCVVKADESREK